MSTDSPHKQEFRIRDLSTRSVLLFPTRAQIIRDIKEVTLQPGANTIVIDGLSPTVDEHSIKVEGTGSATITEVNVDLLPNRELFEDIYPSDSDDDDDEDEEDEEEKEVEAMKTINDKIKLLNVQLLNKQEAINSAAKRLLICDNFGKSVADNRPPINEMETLVKAYQVEREKIYTEHESATAAIDAIREEIAKAEKEKVKLAKALVKASEKQEKAKAKQKQKRLRQKAEIFKEKQRIKEERESFWPKKVYRITITLEPISMTPGSSRRSSIDGDTIVNLATSDFHESPKASLKANEISLSLSYITYSASWSPRYDLNLNSIKCNGILEYGAELKNTTSEVWKDAKIILSTSQTTFSGLSESIPILQPWHVRLLKGARNGESALFSASELKSKQSEWAQTQAGASQKPRREVFGRDTSSHDAYAAQRLQLKKAKSFKRKENVDEILQYNRFAPQSSASAFDAAPPPGGSFGSSISNAHADRGVAELRSSRTHTYGRVLRGAAQYDMEEAEQEDQDSSGFGLFDDGAAIPAQSLTFEEGAWEESGMTTTYEIPGTKILAPSNSTSKQKIAKIDFKNIIFSHIVIGKLRQVAFLKARLRNSSKITLLKGPLGLTLDGSFLGQATFPRCSAGESFSLPLGVDPALTVAYPKPTVRRSQTGIFSKEDTNVFTRTVFLTNTKHNSAAEITVLDQIPISEDERLRIEIINPRGLKVGGDSIKTGASGTSVAGVTAGTAKDVRASVYGGENGNSKWGNAVATAKKGGEVCWNVKLNPGQSVKLVLEYEATFPSGEAVVSQ